MADGDGVLLAVMSTAGKRLVTVLLNRFVVASGGWMR